MRYAVIMAGGAGKRLWPMSRISRPKQLLPLLDGKSLMEIAVERLAGLFEPERILVITNAEYGESVAAALPSLPKENIIGEPDGRDTANAIALGAAILAGKDPDATMAVFTADHVIRPVEDFARSIQQACDVAEQNSDALLTFGIKPTWPHTGLGYIHCKKQVGDGVHEVAAFKEKPDHQTARRYVEGGKHFWNSGMFVWKVDAIQKALKDLLPDSQQKLTAITQAVSEGKDYSAALAEIYPTLKRISIDYAVMEKAKKVLMVELKCEWLDIGSWPALENVTEPDDAGNAIVADNAVLLDSFRNVVVSENGHLIAMLGMDDCIVVRSNDATLICNKTDSQRLKELVAMIEARYGKRYI